MWIGSESADDETQCTHLNNLFTKNKRLTPRFSKDLAHLDNT